MTKSKMANRYSPEVGARAVRMIFEHQGSYETQAGAIAAIAPRLAVFPGPCANGSSRPRRTAACATGRPYSATVLYDQEGYDPSPPVSGKLSAALLSSISQVGGIGR